MATWSKDELHRIAEADDLHIAPFREDGVTYGTPTWIWSVAVDDALYVRAYNGRASRWYRAAQQQKAGRIIAAGMTKEVAFEPVDDAPTNVRVDDAYRAKYRGSPYLGPMIGARARAATVKVMPCEADASTRENEGGSSRDPGCWDRGSSDEHPDEGGEEGLPSPARVVHDLEEGEVERQLLLRDAAMRPQPGAQQRPDALRGVDVHLAEAVAVVIARVLAPGVADRLVPVAPVLQAAVDVVLVGVDQGAFGDARLDHRPDRHLLDVGEHAQDDLAAALEQAQDRRLVLGERAPAGGAPQPPASAGTPLLATAAGWPLWPATT